MKSAIGVLAAVCALCALPASAQINPQGLYLGGAIGQARHSGFCDIVPDIGSCDEKDTAWKILGGYQFHPNLAVELGYVDLGQSIWTISNGTNTGRVSLEGTAFELLGVATVPLGLLSLYGKFGFYHGEATVRGSVTGPGGFSRSESDSGTEPTFGFGVRFDVSPRFAIRGEWQRYSDFADVDIDVLSIAVLFRLGR